MNNSQTTCQRRKPNLVRGAIGLFLLLTCIRVWVGSEPILEPVQAQIPDSGMQRKLLLEEVRQTNRLLSNIKQLLETGTLNVRIQGADNQADRAAVLRNSGK